MSTKKFIRRPLEFQRINASFEFAHFNSTVKLIDPRATVDIQNRCQIRDQGLKHILKSYLGIGGVSIQNL